MKTPFRLPRSPEFKSDQVRVVEFNRIIRSIIHIWQVLKDDYGQLLQRRYDDSFATNLGWVLSTHDTLIRLVYIPGKSFLFYV